MPDGVALVTGASRGIGRAVATALAEAGHRVAVNYAISADDSKETLREVEEAGGSGACFCADVSDPAAVGSLFDEVEEALGPVEILVNNAGVRRDGLAISMKDEMWDEVIATNLSGPFFCARRALRGMLRRRHGRIVNVSSVAGLRGSPGQVNYSAAKAGLIGLTRTLAREVGSKGITVNAIAPGPVETDLTGSLNAEQWDALVDQVPGGRAATTSEVAALVVYLCGEGAAYVNGSVLVVDGGMTA